MQVCTFAHHVPVLDGAHCINHRPLLHTDTLALEPFSDKWQVEWAAAEYGSAESLLLVSIARPLPQVPMTLASHNHFFGGAARTGIESTV